jgi:Tol biopolymer transport system component
MLLMSRWSCGVAIAAVTASVGLTFETPAQAPAGYELTLAAVDGTKKVVGRLPPTVYAPRVSPDGRQVAFETRDPSGPDGGRLWVAPLSNLDARRALPGTGAPLNWAPMWTPDGTRLLFLAAGAGPDAIHWRRADGSGESEHLLDARSAEGWNDRGAVLRYLTLTGNGDYGISLFDMKARTSTRLIDLPGSAQHSSAVSPDGRWIAYASNETGRYEVWLEPMPPTTVRYRLTKNGGSHPLWLPDGRSLYFDKDRQLFELALNLDGPAPVGDPKPLPITGFAQAEYRRQFDLMPNGREFLVLVPLPNR